MPKALWTALVGPSTCLSSGPSESLPGQVVKFTASLVLSQISCIRICIIASSQVTFIPCSEQHWLELTLPHLLLTSYPLKELPAALQFRTPLVPSPRTAWTAAFLQMPGEYRSPGLGWRRVCGFCSMASGPDGQLLPSSWFGGRAHSKSADQTKGEGGQSIDNDQVCTWVQACQLSLEGLCRFSRI